MTGRLHLPSAVGRASDPTISLSLSSLSFFVFSCSVLLSLSLTLVFLHLQVSPQFLPLFMPLFFVVLLSLPGSLLLGSSRLPIQGLLCYLPPTYSLRLLPFSVFVHVSRVSCSLFLIMSWSVRMRGWF